MYWFRNLNQNVYRKLTGSENKIDVSLICLLIQNDINESFKISLFNRNIVTYSILTLEFQLIISNNHMNFCFCFFPTGVVIF